MSEIKRKAPPPVGGSRGGKYAKLAQAALDSRGEWFSMEIEEKDRASAHSAILAAVGRLLAEGRTSKTELFVRVKSEDEL
jgi:hypothetical protein